MPLPTTMLKSRPGLAIALHPAGTLIYRPLQPTGDPNAALDPATQEAQLAKTPVPAGVDFKLHNGTKQRPLETWLDAPAAAGALCLQTGLTVVLDKGVAGAIQLFPLSKPPTATLKWTDASGAQSAPFSDVTLDQNQNKLTLHLAFGSDANGRKLYAQVLNAMTSPTAKAVATVAYEFTYTIMQTPPATTGSHAVFNPRLLAATEMMRPEVGPLHPIAPHPVPHPPPPPPPPPPAPVPHQVALAKTFDIALFRATDAVPDPYPDVIKANSTGWQAFTPVQGGQTLFYKPSTDALTYYYLPNTYSLGFYVENDGSILAPISADTYLSDSYRIRVRLVALPVIDTTQREALRKHICQDVLHNLVPYVSLTPAPGLAPHFIDGSFGSLASGATTASTNLPASVQVKSVDLASERRLVFELDMAAMDYAIVCELLRRGVHGSLDLDDSDFHQSVNVLLKLDQLAASVLDLKGTDRHVTITNLLDYPVQVDSVTAFFVALGDSAGMVFAAESHELFPAGQLLGAKGQPGATIDVDVPTASSDAYTNLFVLAGMMRPQAGTVDDWIDRVSRDPSLQPRGIALSVSPVASPNLTAAVSAINVTLYRDGDPKPRFQQPIPLAPATSISVLASLVDLMGVGGKPPTFSLEYYCHYKDDSIGLPQRVQIDPTQTTLNIVPIVETDDCQYIVVYDTDTGEQRTDPLDPDAANDKLTALRTAGTPWTLSIVHPDPATPTTPDPTTTTPPVITPPVTTAPPYTGAPVTMVTSLLAFAAGGLQQVFVVLSTTEPDAPTSTFLFDAANHVQLTWKPDFGTLPPFNYKITYVYANGATKVLGGQEADRMLVLDPPPPPT